MEVKEPYVVSLISIIEITSVIRRKYLELAKKGEKSRAEGYIRFLNLTLSHIRNNVVEVTFRDVERGIELMFERDVNLGEAVNTMVAKRLNLTVISSDKDWESLRDIIDVENM
ncbi:PIN domain-containing protein [Sulfolobus acidocaldarius]|uniref:PIN domain-containing protein n=1 Tax=Sulfolobus acidocaldarius TaxID=2285 RepID=UPI001E5EAE96|nr:PIN domain-containing protein [Sulfolobus acidocaldarius]